MKIRSAFVVPNPSKEWAVKLQKDVVHFLEKHGVSVIKGGEALITIGGDGTLLHAKKKQHRLVFGIGSEKSFICQSNLNNWRSLLSRVLRSCRVERRSMLQCRISRRVYEDALNEICIRSRDHRVIEISLSFPGKRRRFRADGILFSTPTGSTAYAYSCGAPELPPRVRKYEIVPIAPYRREFQPVIVPDSAKCEMKVIEGNADLVIDGQFIHKVLLNSKIRVQRSEKKLGLLKPA
jgi:NAD+ kinase